MCHDLLSSFISEVFLMEREGTCACVNCIQCVKSAMKKDKINRKIHGHSQRFGLNSVCRWLIYSQEFPKSRLLKGLWSPKHGTADGKLELSDTVYASKFQRNHWIVHVLVGRTHLFPSSKQTRALAPHVRVCCMLRNFSRLMATSCII